jgi:hypothetical protein
MAGDVGRNGQLNLASASAVDSVSCLIAVRPVDVPAIQGCSLRSRRHKWLYCGGSRTQFLLTVRSICCSTPADICVSPSRCSGVGPLCGLRPASGRPVHDLVCRGGFHQREPAGPPWIFFAPNLSGKGAFSVTMCRTVGLTPALVSAGAITFMETIAYFAAVITVRAACGTHGRGGPICAAFASHAQGGSIRLADSSSP